MIPARGDFLWTAAAIERLRRLWADGLTVREIASDLGTGSRNSVIGKVHRLGLEKRPSPLGQRLRVAPKLPRVIASEAKQPIREEPDASRGEAPQPRVEADRPVAAPPQRPAPPPGPVTFLARAHGQCAWPLSGKPGPLMLVCGQPVPVGHASWCMTHRAIGWGRGTPAERSAAREAARAA